MVVCCGTIPLSYFKITKDRFVIIIYQGLVKELDGFVFGPKKDLLFDTICNVVFSA